MGRQYLTVETTDLAKFICQFKSQFLANKLANKCSQFGVESARFLCLSIHMGGFPDPKSFQASRPCLYSYFEIPSNPE